MKLLRNLSLLLSLLLFVAVSMFLGQCSQPESEEVTRKDDFQFINHDPAVGYVGKNECRSCHSDIFETFQHTGKGRAFHEPSDDKIIEDFSHFVVKDTFTDLSYTSFWRGGEMFQSEFRLKGRDTVHLLERPVHQVIGSGNQARTYIYIENEYHYELPLTWYVEKGIWALSPGYEDGNNNRFDRPITEMCMHCHNSDYTFAPQSQNRFVMVGQGIGCEKCHGPGEAHVNMMKEGTFTSAVDKGIINPGNLPVQLGFDVCRQCHLEGVTVNKDGKELSDFLPGKPLNDYVEVFMAVSEDAADYGFASHAERLQMSSCFKQSNRKLTCTTCHDPHKPLPGAKVLFYKEKCLSCHQIDDCGEEHALMIANQNDCASCHMPRSGTTDIPHVSTSDHFIRVHDGDTTVQQEKDGKLKHFESYTSKNISAKDLALANMEYFEKVDHDPAYLARVSSFLNQLSREQAIKYAYLSGGEPGFDVKTLSTDFITDGYTAYFVGEIMRRKGLPSLSWFQRAHDLAPLNIDILHKLGEAYAMEEKIPEAINALENVVELKSLHAPALASLGYLYLRMGEIERAERTLLQALKADPNEVLVKENLLNVYLAKEDWKAAERQLSELLEISPGHSGYIRVRQMLDER